MHHFFAMPYPVSLLAIWLVSLGLSLTPLHAQVYLSLTAESYLHHQDTPRPGRYHIEVTPAFIDGLIDAHLAGEVILYRDFEHNLPYPDRATFDRYLAEQRRPEWDQALQALAKQPGVSDSLTQLEERRIACEACLNPVSRWFLQAGRDSSTLRDLAASPEEQLSLFKQIGKSRAGFQQMAGLEADQFQRYLMLSARFDQPEKEQATLSWEQGILLVSYFPLSDPRQAPVSHALFFDFDPEAVPWFLLKTTPLLAGIREESGAQALLTELQSDFAPLGYRMITEEGPGKWESLYVYAPGEDRQADILRKDSLRHSWPLEQALMSAEQLTSLYPRQSKSVSRWLDGRWTPEYLAQQPLNPWARAEQADFGWEATQAMIQSLTPQFFPDLAAGHLSSYRPGGTEETVPFAEMRNRRRQYALQLHRSQADPNARPNPDTLPTSWRSLEEQTYSWRLRGEYVWLMGKQTFEPRWLDIFWHPPGEDATAYPWLSLAWSDLAAREYVFDQEPLTERLRGDAYGYYPTQVNHSEINDPNHATMVRLILSRGAWDAFPGWLMAQQAPPTTGDGPAADWKAAWKTVRKAIRRSAYR